jgi:hypothetical protein
MALRPNDISAANLGIALKPLFGREKKLKISLLPAIEIANMTVTGVNALSTTLINAGATQLNARPSEVLIKLDEEVRAGAAIQFGVVGTDQDGAYLSGAAKFSNPTYAQEQGYALPPGTAREVVVTSGRKFKTVTQIIPTAADAEALGAKFSVFGMPDQSSYVLVGCRVNLNYSTESREPMSVACGGDESAFVKPGQKPKREVSVTVKLPTLSDGLKRYNGMSNIVALAVSDKEDRVVTDHEYLIGMQISGRHSDPESSEPSTLEATGQYEDYAHIPAGPLA